jgi:hypothetical protein
MPFLLRHLLAITPAVTVQSMYESSLPRVSHLTPLCEGAKRAVTTLFNVLNRRFQRFFNRVQQRVWRQRSKLTSRKPKIATETVALIQTMACDNRLWGAERIRGGLLKLGIRVSKRTIQKYMRQPRARPSSQTWSAFLHNQG